MRKLKNSELNRLSVEEYKKTEKIPIIVILDNVRSLSNVGSIFRTCDALLIEEVILCGITATPPHRELHKTALGAEDAVTWRYFEHTTDAIDALKRDGFVIVAVEQVENSIMLDKFEATSTQKYAFVFGNEVKGVRQDAINRCHSFLEIPQYGTKHSFNISISVGMVLWEVFKQMKN